ncbi:MAG: biotin/lipoyl-containing protein [Rikenellaceae bacterium]
MKELNFKINGNAYSVTIDVKDENKAVVVVNGATYAVELDNATVKRVVAQKPQVAAVPASHPVTNLASPAARPAPAAVAAGEQAVNSPLPGVVIDIRVKEGDAVEAGQTLLVLEAMKMENNIDSPAAGVVKSIKARTGDSVLEGDILITIG